MARLFDIYEARSPRQMMAAVERAEAAGLDQEKINRAVADGPGPWKTVAQLMTAFGHGASFGAIPSAMEGLGFEDAAQRHRDYMGEAQQQHPRAVPAAQALGGAASLTAGVLAPTAIGARAAAGRSVLQGPGSFPGTLRWGVAAPVAAGLLDVPQEAQAQEASIEELQRLGTMPNDAGPQAVAPPQERPLNAGLPGMPPALGQFATQQVTSPEVQAELERRAEMERLHDARYGEMLTPGRNVVGHAAPGTGVAAGGAAVGGAIGSVTLDILPVIGDVVAVKDIFADILQHDVGAPTMLALASLIPAVPRIKGVKKISELASELRAADKIRAIRNINPRLLDDVPPPTLSERGFARGPTPELDRAYEQAVREQVRKLPEHQRVQLQRIAETDPRLLESSDEFLSSVKNQPDVEPYASRRTGRTGDAPVPTSEATMPRWKEGEPKLTLEGPAKPQGHQYADPKGDFAQPKTTARYDEANPTGRRDTRQPTVARRGDARIKDPASTEGQGLLDVPLEPRTTKSRHHSRELYNPEGADLTRKYIMDLKPQVRREYISRLSTADVQRLADMNVKQATEELARRAARR